MSLTLILVATTVGVTLSTAFSAGCLAISFFAIPALLIPRGAPLMPPLELVTAKKKRDPRFNTEKAPKQPIDSGIGDEKETIFNSGATEKVLRNENEGGSPSSTSYLLRQWFHLFAKGMYTFPPLAIGSAASYLSAAYMLPGDVTEKRVAYVLAAVLSAGIMVFTQTALKPTNNALHARVKEVVEQEMASEGDKDVDDKRAETEMLIREWGRINAWRALMPIGAVVCAIVGLVM